MSNNTKASPASELITRIFSQINPEKVQEAGNVINAWQRIVQEIPRNGIRMADHCRILDLKNGVLRVETDHPGWIQLFQVNHSTLLKKLQREFPQLNIKSISYKLAGREYQTEPVHTLKEPTRVQRLAALEQRLGQSVFLPEPEKTGEISSEKPPMDEKLALLLKKLKNSLESGNKE